MSTFYRTGNVCVSKMKFPIDVKYIADAPSGKGKKKKRKFLFQEIHFKIRHSERLVWGTPRSIKNDESDKPECEFQF